MGTRRNFSAEFKAKVALEALVGDQTLAATGMAACPNTVSACLKQLHLSLQRNCVFRHMAATCFGFKVATPRSVATLVGLGWVSGFFESSFL